MTASTPPRQARRYPSGMSDTPALRTPRRRRRRRRRWRSPTTPAPSSRPGRRSAVDGSCSSSTPRTSRPAARPRPATSATAARPSASWAPSSGASASWTAPPRPASRQKHGLDYPAAGRRGPRRGRALRRLGGEAELRQDVHGHRAHDVPGRPEGRIARVWPKVSVEGHAAEVLEALRAPRGPPDPCQ